MDKRTIQGYVLIFVIIVGFTYFQSSTHRKAQEEKAKTEKQDQENAVAENIENATEATITIADTNAVVVEDSTEKVVEEQEVVIPEEIYTLSNDELEIGISSKGGAIVEVALKNYKRFDSTELVLISPEDYSFNYTFNTKTGVVSTSELDFKSAEKTDKGVTLSYDFPGGGSISQSYTLNENFGLDYSVVLHDMDQQIPVRNREYLLDIIQKTQQQEKAIKDERSQSSVYFRYASESGIEKLSLSKSDEEDLSPNLHWVSFKQKFFNSTYVFPEFNTETGNTVTVEVPEDDSYLKQMETSLNIPFNGGASDGFEMQMYFGPNHYQTLKKLDIKLEKVIPLGWGIIGWVNKGLIIPVFNWLDSYFASFGLIILILTLLIKGILIFPMYKIYVSSAKMKLLKPELDELKAKHGSNMQKMQQEQMKLYKKAGASPFGGCLPQLVQFPILIAMFRFFPASIELRQQSFLWATDLSTYDSILNLGFSIPMYGDHVSLFTLLMAGSTLLYTLTNQQMSAGINNQMKYIMYLMPVMLLVWFNSYAAGLSYYYFLANMITFGQNFIFRKYIVDDAKLHKQIQEHKKKKGPIKKSRFQKRIEDMAKKQGMDPKTMKKR